MGVGFEDRTVWITGASSGIGEACARELARGGARLILSARRVDRLDALKASLPWPERAFVLPMDMAEQAAMPDKVAQAQEAFGGVDVLLHNAGISQRSLARDTQMEVYRRIMEVNFFGVVALTGLVLPTMLARGRGHLAAVTSVAGHVGTPLRSAYAASKHALHGYFDSVRAEVHDQGVRVTLICPGFIHTEITQHALTGDGKPLGLLGRGQKAGMSAQACAEQLVEALAQGREELYIGGAKEGLALLLKRAAPTVLSRALRKVDPT
jgi:short-subunit dehydrogenase